MSNTTNYDAKHFADVANSPLGQDIWKFLNEHDNVIRLETATELRSPAVEGVALGLTSLFGAQVQVPRVKQMIGHMTRQILEARGWRLEAQLVKVKTGNLFSTGSRYTRDSSKAITRLETEPLAE